MSSRWIEWNRDHIAEHGVSCDEAEMVVRRLGRHFLGRSRTTKWRCRWTGAGRPVLPVIYVPDPDKTVFIIVPGQSPSVKSDVI